MTANALIGLATLVLATLGCYVVLRAIVRAMRRAGRAAARVARSAGRAPMVAIGRLQDALDRGAPDTAAATSNAPGQCGAWPRPAHPGQCGAWPRARLDGAIVTFPE